MNIKKKVRTKTAQTWNSLSVYSAFNRRHKAIYEQPEFSKNSLTAREKKEYRDYWKNIFPIVNFKTAEISKSLSGKFDKRIVPEEFYSLYIEPALNNDKTVAFLENKSVYNKWFGRGIFPKDFFYKLNGIYYTSNHNKIEDIDDFINNTINNQDFPMVIKPNKGSYGGRDIYFVNTKNEIKEIIKQHPNLVVQEKIVQSELINAFNKDSINTVRVCLYKDNDGEIYVLNTSIRMGKDGSLDNETSGGIVCNIKSTGVLNSYAVDKYAKKYLSHPNSGFVFADQVFPLYNELLEASKSVFESITEARTISLDMCLDSNEKWRCIELNFFGQTIRFAQYAGQPFLGEHTDNIISELTKKS